MPCTVGWFVPEKVYYVTISGDLSFEEYVVMVDASDQLFRTTDAPTLHTFTYIHNLGKFPLDLKVYQQISKPKNMSRTGWVLVIAHPHPFISFIVATLGQWIGFKFRMFNDLEAALTFLNEQDDNLPPLLPLIPDFLSSLSN